MTADGGQAGKAPVRRGVAITPATLELETPEIEQANNEMPEMVQLGPTGLSPAQIAALIIGGLVCAGVILRFVMFNTSRRPMVPRDSEEGKRS